MTKARRVLVGVVAVVALFAAACGDDGGGSGDSSGGGGGGDAGGGGGATATGVTDDSIKVGVLVADLDGLRASGVDLPESLTTANLANRWLHTFEEWNAEGGINGRQIEPVTIGWDPVDPASFEDVCNEATLDEEVFMVVNASGFRGGAVPCFTVDHDTFFFFGEGSDLGTIEASGENLVVMGVPAEVSGATAANVALEDGFVDDDDRVGILSGNEPAIQAGGNAVESALEEAGVDVTKVEINSLQADVTAINQESAAAVDTFAAEGVDFVFVTLPFVAVEGFFGEAGESGSRFDYMIVDIGQSACAAFGASRTPAEAAGAPCVTAWNTWALPDGEGLREPTEFEAECRERFDEQFDTESYPGVPTGEEITTSDGRTLSSDFAASECTMLPLLRQALETAGDDLTHESLHAAFLEITSAPAAMLSDGGGGFGPDKPFFANRMHAVQLVVNSPDAALDANGETYNGCPAPVNCWVPLTGNWFDIET
jgi:ABC-type branched-subunit amino acid transport system substrate-binding protein